MYEKDFFERLNLQQLCAFLRTGGRLSPKAVEDGIYCASEEEAAVRRAVELGVRGIGLDTMGIDPMDAADFPRHHLMFERGLVIVENLRGLSQLAGRRFFFAALPLKYKNADGAPVRAVGIEN